MGRDNEEGISYDVAWLYCRTRQACCSGAETMRREYIFVMLPCYITGQNRLVSMGQRQRGGNINDVVLLYSRTSEAFCFGAETMRREYLMILPSYIAGQGRLVAVGQKQRGGNIYL